MVAPIDVATQLDLLEVRRPMEELAVRLAAARATAEQRKRLRELVGDLLARAADDDQIAYLQANRALQETIQAAAHNGVLANSIRIIYGMSRRFWYSALSSRENLQRAAQLHATTMLAVADGQGDLAAIAVGTFLVFLEKLTRETLDRRI
jgi:DNA-binding GntR family transcriptional regulator